MKSKKVNIKKILYIILLVVLGLLFVASLTFGAIAAFAGDVRDSLEVWFSSKLKKTEFSLLAQSIKWLLVSSVLLIFTLSFKDFKRKFID